MRLRREHPRADERQRAAVRAELHATVDRVVDDWPTIDSLALMATTADTAGRSGNGHANPTMAAALTQSHHPAWLWLDAFRDLRVRLRVLDSQRAKLMPVRVLAGRRSEVEVCTECHLPAPKVRRIDGLPYCASSCYYRVWRGSRPGPAA